MSSTNLTKNLKLPQFVASDKPSWLGDVNGAMKKIDDGYSALSGDISKANDTASSAKSQSDANTQTLTNVNNELENYGNRITALEAGGGTEQLEQRVNTLSSDVEALQTRADTFEEEIAENGTNITSLTGRVTSVEGKVKTNEDNVNSLIVSTNGLSDSINLLTTKLDTTTTIANSANSQANVNKSNITSLNNTLNSTNSILNIKAELTQYGLGDSKIGGVQSLLAIKGGTSIYFIPFYAFNNTGYAIGANSNLFSISLNEFSKIVEATIGSSFQTTGLVGSSNAGFYWAIDTNKLVLKCTSVINNSNSLSIQMPSILVNE